MKFSIYSYNHLCTVSEVIVCTHGYIINKVSNHISQKTINILNNFINFKLLENIAPFFVLLKFETVPLIRVQDSVILVKKSLKESAFTENAKGLLTLICYRHLASRKCCLSCTLVIVFTILTSYLHKVA